MSGKLHPLQNNEDTIVDEPLSLGVKADSEPEEEPGQEQPPGWVANMALPPSGDEEPGSQTTSRKRMVHNAVERRRKVKINNYIYTLEKLLPNPEGKRLSKNETLQKAVEYIHEIKEAHDKLVVGKLDDIHVREFKRLKCRIEGLEKQNSVYAKLLQAAGIPTNADPATISGRNTYKNKPATIPMECNGDVIVIEDSDDCKEGDKYKNTNCKKRNGNNNESSYKETKSAANRSGESSPSNLVTTCQNGMVLVAPATNAQGQFSTVVQKGTAGVGKAINKKNSEVKCPGNSKGPIQSTIVTTLSTVNPMVSVPLTNACENGGVTAVTRSLSGAPIMSTNQISSCMQQQAVVPQLPMLQFDGTMNFMQRQMHQLITINDQGIPMLQMVSGPAPMGPGQVIMNGNPTQNVLLMGNSSGSAGPTGITSNMNSAGILGQQTLHVAGPTGVPTNNIHMECQTGQSQNLIQTDAGIYTHAVCGGQLIGPTTQYLPNFAGTMQQIQSTNAANPQMHLMSTGTNAPNPQMHLMNTAMNAQINSRVISAQNGNVMLGATMQGSQHSNNNTVLTMNSSANSNLPSALMLPNGQIIPVVRESPIMYPNSGQMGSNLLVATATSNSPQPMFSTSQAPAGNSTTLSTASGRPLAASCEYNIGSNGIVPSTSLAQLHSMTSSVTTCHAVTQSRSIPSRTAQGSNGRMGSFGDPPSSASLPIPSVSADVSSLSGKTCDSPNSSAVKKSPPRTKKKSTAKRAQRVIKPKPKPTTSSDSSPPSLLLDSVAASLSKNTKASPVSDAATPETNSAPFPAISSLDINNKPDSMNVEYPSSNPAMDTVSSGIAKSAQKKQTNSRPANIMNDILAQATESIFSNSISDISSSPNPNYFGNSGSNSNSSQVDFLENVELSDKISPVRSDFSAALVKAIPSAEAAGTNGSEHNDAENAIMDISSDSMQSEKNRQPNPVDILGDLVGDVYSTTTNDVPKLLSDTSHRPPTTCSAFSSAFSPKNTDTVISNLDSCAESFSVLNSVTGPTEREADLSTASAGPKYKRSFGDAESPAAKRPRSNCLTLDSATAEAECGVTKETNSNSVETNLSSVNPSQSIDSAAATTTSNSVNFVSISQLASSASTTTTCSSSVATFTNTMAPPIASFTIDTSISNVNSPLCSISPLLSSPSKNGDLTYALSSAISDLPRSEESHFPTTGSSCTIAISQGSYTMANGPFSSLSQNFGASTSTTPTFCLPDLSNPVPASNTQSGFRGMCYSGPATLHRNAPNYNVISSLHQIASEPPPPSGSTVPVPAPFADKSHKINSLHYNHASLNNHQPQISSRHALNPPTDESSGHHNPLSGNNLQFSTSHIPVQIPPYSQAYSTPLSHHSSHHHVPRPPIPNANTSPTDASKSKSSTQRRPNINTTDGVQQNGIMSPPMGNHTHMLCPGPMHQMGSHSESIVSGVGPPQQRQSHNYLPQRMNSLSRQSPLEQANVPQSPKTLEMHGHSPISSRGPTANRTSPKPNLPVAQSHVSRNHPVPSPGRNALPTPPISSPATFAPRRSPNVPAGHGPMIMSYADNSAPHGTFRGLNFDPGQKQLTHPPIVSTMNTSSRASISYSAESLIQAHPNNRPNCAREGRTISSVNNAGRQPQLGTHMHNGGIPVPTASSLQVMQGTGNRSNTNEVHQTGFPYFPTFQQHSSEQLSPHQMHLPPPPQGGNAAKQPATQNHSGINKTCAMRGTPESSQAIQSQPNFSFSLLQHCQPDQQQQQTQQSHQQLQGVGQDINLNPSRHGSNIDNTYLPMANYGQGPTSVSLQGGPAHKDMQIHKAPMTFPCMPPFSHNQNLPGQPPNARQVSNNFLQQNGMNFSEMYSAQNNLRNDSINGHGGGGSSAGGGTSSLQVTEKAASNQPYKSRNTSSKQDGTTKSSKSKQQSKKKHHQYSVEEVNLSNSIFETGRSMTPYFTIPNLSPPRNEVPTYIPNPNPLFNPPPQRGLAPNSSQQAKAPDLGTGYSNLFTPRTQSGLNLNFQAPGFGGFGNGSMPNQITPHNGGVNIPTHVPNFNLSNIFPDINNSNEGISISPIKFHHGNPILPPPQPGMEHNLQHHHQSGPLYHKRSHPPSVIHNGMTINSLLGHNPHTFDGRPQVPMGINNTMAPPFHAHSHTPSFSNVIPTLNFSMHDH